MNYYFMLTMNYYFMLTIYNLVEREKSSLHKYYYYLFQILLCPSLDRTFNFQLFYILNLKLILLRIIKRTDFIKTLY